MKKNKFLGIRIEEELEDAIKQEASGEDRSKAAQARRILREHFIRRGVLKKNSSPGK